MRNIKIILLVIVCVFVAPRVTAQGSDDASQEPVSSRVLTIDEFIQLATERDTEFEAILIDRLPLQYRKDLNLPAGNIVMEVRAQYDLYLTQDKREEPEAAFALSKLFPYTGTELTAEYSSTPSLTSVLNSSDFNFTISQPIAENAFGKATRLSDKIIGVEIDVIKHQIAEAYEDYLAAIMVAYFDWLEAHENLKIGESSYAENLKLMDNINDRQKSSIALPIDVNKINLQVLAKKEKLIELREKYQNALNFIKKAVRDTDVQELIPQKPDIYKDFRVTFDSDYHKFEQESRTYQILKFLEEKSALQVDKDADDLLPSINLLVGYSVDGKDHEIRNEDNMAFAAVSMEWPLPDQVERAEYKTSKIALDKQKLATGNTRVRLSTDIKNLFQIIDREELLGAVAREKIGLARSVLEAETENYSFGKVTINDYIQAVNNLDNNRFNEALHDAQYQKFIVEWLRITDRLISQREINQRHP
jgi:outer membrane protein TolC